MLAEELGYINIDDEDEFVVVSREERLRRAFLESKASYPRECIFTEANVSLSTILYEIRIMRLMQRTSGSKI